MLRVELALLCLYGLGGCLLGGCEHGATPERAGTEAPAAPVRLEAALVAELARQLKVPLERARELAVEDALLATELERREPAVAQSLRRLVLARELAQALLTEAELGGPPNERELAALESERWWELDRPRMVQVVHAVVISQTESKEASALAESIASAVAQATNAAEFERAAKAVPTGGQQVKVESLPPVTADGRSVDPERAPPLGPVQQFAPEFGAAAQKLERVGQLSPVVRTPFGYHVLLALRIVEPFQPAPAELRERARPEVMQRRALVEQRRLLAEQRQESKPQQERSALRSIAQLVVSP